MLGVAIDAGTGAWNALSPENVSVTLQKQAASASGPETIDVQLGTAHDGHGTQATLNVEAEEPVHVKVEKID